MPWQVGCFFVLLVVIAAWEGLPDPKRTEVLAGPAGHAVRFAFWVAVLFVYGSLLL